VKESVVDESRYSTDEQGERPQAHFISSKVARALGEEYPYGFFRFETFHRKRACRASKKLGLLRVTKIGLGYYLEAT
jgi:hypothetical protein